MPKKMQLLLSLILALTGAADAAQAWTPATACMPDLDSITLRRHQVLDGAVLFSPSADGTILLICPAIGVERIKENTAYLGMLVGGTDSGIAQFEIRLTLKSRNILTGEVFTLTDAMITSAGASQTPNTGIRQEWQRKATPTHRQGTDRWRQRVYWLEVKMTRAKAYDSLNPVFYGYVISPTPYTP